MEAAAQPARLVGRLVACAFFEKNTMRYARYPFRAFRGSRLFPPALRAAIFKDKECLRDLFMRVFAADFGGEMTEATERLLRMLASIWELSMEGTEYEHGQSNRRERSAATKPLDVQMVSAVSMMMSFPEYTPMTLLAESQMTRISSLWRMSSTRSAPGASSKVRRCPERDWKTRRLFKPSSLA